MATATELDLENIDNTLANIRTAKRVSDFHSHRRFDPNSSTNFHAGPSNGERDPAIVAKDLESHMSYLHKLKYVYLERRAEDKYTKTIVSTSDETGTVNEEENQRLQLENEEKKARLRADKARMKEVYAAMRDASPAFQTGYERLQEQARRMRQLKENILNKQLELLRLQQTNPPPRFTEASATAKLDAQAEEMQNLNDELEYESRETEGLKERAKGCVADIERLRTERVQLETQVKQMNPEGIDELTIARQHQIFTAKLEMHQRMWHLRECTAVSENELRLLYDCFRAAQPVRLVISLVFVPAQQRLASVDVAVIRLTLDGSEAEELEVDFGDNLGAKIDVNDVRAALNIIFSHVQLAGE
ncbi:hypothetical protein BD626DRAFT_548675 [Schizophyllum amplum]|uniref:Kinetochore protein Sos7 coiled-coil domain-containing protein n=1 Tax=Schizophyllum amplum TaxID=97359 RepID=A0A550CBW2_9AGAR|nr:hypothetical protein BD626DRAFT_548675 [Auriculariopsis ampla]